MHICLWTDRFGKNIHNGTYYFCYKSAIYDIMCLMLTRFDLLCQTGPNGATEENWGVNYRALNDLFHISQNRTGSVAYEVGVQMFEIYNETLRDLLSNDNSPRKYPF